MFAKSYLALALLDGREAEYVLGGEISSSESLSPFIIALTISRTLFPLICVELNCVSRTVKNGRQLVKR